MILFRKVTHSNSTISFHEIELIDKPLSSGGEGGVYRLAGQDWWLVKCGNTTIRKRACAKVYSNAFLNKHEKELEKKLSFMIDPVNRPDFLDDGVQQLIQVCYPFSLLYDSPKGHFVGFLMYFALEDSASLTLISVDRSPKYYKKLRELGILDPKEWDLFVKFRFPDLTHTEPKRYAIVFNIASTIHYLHETGKYVIADIKPDNFLVNLRGGISLVDINSVQVSNGRKCFPSLVATPDYIPPEMQKNPLGNKTVAFDCFSMAVVFYQVLTGTHPYSYSVKDSSLNLGTSVQEHIMNGKFACGKSRKKYILAPQHKRYDNLPEELKQLFLRAFEGPARSRPSAQEWMVALKPICKKTLNPTTTSCLKPRSPLPPRDNKHQQKNGAVSKKTAGNNPPRQIFAWTKVCPMCGTPYLNPDSSRYCYHCGTMRK